jgi:hypothetical protein
MVAPSLLHLIGDLTKEDDQMIIILRSVSFRNAHVMVMLAHSDKGVSGTIFYYSSYCC